MKGTLTFNLPAEDDEHRTAIFAYRWRAIVEELDNQMRSCLKYGSMVWKTPDDVAAYVRDYILANVPEE